jgi:hypothetical protein
VLKAFTGKMKEIPLVTWIVGIFFILKHLL